MARKEVIVKGLPAHTIHRPHVSPLLDYQGQLGFVVGRRCRHVPKEHAAGVIP